MTLVSGYSVVLRGSDHRERRQELEAQAAPTATLSAIPQIYPAARRTTADAHDSATWSKCTLGCRSASSRCPFEICLHQRLHGH